MKNITQSFTQFQYFVGVVEDRDDPLKLGRVRVRALGPHSEHKSDIPTQNLPWAVPVMPFTSASMNGIGQSPTGPVEGTWVFGFFIDGQEQQQPIITGTLNGMPDQRRPAESGFSDPNGVYPRSAEGEEFHQESDVNRLARNENLSIEEPTSGPVGTGIIVQLKKDNLDKEVPIASIYNSNNVIWNEPVTPYAAKYPFNHVYESERGHIFEIDDTVGAERLHKYHRTGTFEEVHTDGTRVTKIQSNNYSIIAGSDFCHIIGNCHITVDANASLYIKGNLVEQVDGNYELTVKGNKTETIEGNVGELILGRKLENVKGDVSELFESNKTESITSTHDLSAKAHYIEGPISQSGGDITSDNISVQHHIHGGVDSGPDTTDEPQ